MDVYIFLQGTSLTLENPMLALSLDISRKIKILLKVTNVLTWEAYIEVSLVSCSVCGEIKVSKAQMVQAKMLSKVVLGVRCA